MRFELLVVPDCPHQAAAADLFRSALAAVGLPTKLSAVVTADPRTAELRKFSGSPSFYADGRDLFPTDQQSGVACRLYATDRGLSGLPTQESLIDALNTAMAASGNP